LALTCRRASLAIFNISALSRAIICSVLVFEG
jgi:hypothetical protein